MSVPAKKGILPPYRETITPLNSNTPIIFHSMRPILLHKGRIRRGPVFVKGLLTVGACLTASLTG